MKKWFFQDINDMNGGLIKAAKNGHLDIVKFLHAIGAGIQVLDHYAIGWASGNGHLPVVAIVIRL